MKDGNIKEIGFKKECTSKRLLWLNTKDCLEVDKAKGKKSVG